MGIVAATLAPLGANASNPKDNKDSTEYKMYRQETTTKLDDSTTYNAYMLSLENGKEEYYQNEFKETKKLGGGYEMVRTECTGNEKNSDELILHTPDGRKINCNDLKVNFVSAGEITDMSTGVVENITEKEAVVKNFEEMNKLRVKIKAKCENPKDREVIWKYFLGQKEKASQKEWRNVEVKTNSCSYMTTGKVNNNDKLMKFLRERGIQK